MDDEEATHLQGILKAFSDYERRSVAQIDFLHSELKEMPLDHQVVSSKSLSKLQQIENCVWANQIFLNEVIQVSYHIFPELKTRQEVPESTIIQTEHATKVVVTLSQCVRDWSIEGSPEREMCYTPIIRAIEEYYPRKTAKRKNVRILVPGCGLARLPWELALRGFEVEGNEFTYFMLLASTLILHAEVTTEFALYPYATSNRNVVDVDSQLRKVTIPDVDPGQAQVTMQAGDFLVEYNHDRCRGAYNCVATCFFIDTAKNVIEYVQQISRLLSTGGLWINFGPLLYHFSDMNKYQNKKYPSLDLTYEELKGVFPYFGLKLLEEKINCPCTYNRDARSGATVEFSCVFFVCKKTSDSFTMTLHITLQAPLDFFVRLRIFIDKNLDPPFSR